MGVCMYTITSHQKYFPPSAQREVPMGVCQCVSVSHQGSRHVSWLLKPTPALSCYRDMRALFSIFKWDLAFEVCFCLDIKGVSNYAEPPHGCSRGYPSPPLPPHGYSRCSGTWTARRQHRIQRNPVKMMLAEIKQLYDYEILATKT